MCVVHVEFVVVAAIVVAVSLLFAAVFGEKLALDDWNFVL